MLIENSQDILNVSKTIAVLVLSALSGVLLYYLAMTIRQFFLTIKEVRDRIKAIDEVVTKFKEKIEHSASYLFLISKGVEKIIEIANKQKNSK